MRVLMVCSQFPPVYGGAGAQANLLARELVTRGADVEVVTLDQYGAGASNDGFPVHRILRGVTARGPFSRALTTLGLGVTSAVRVLIRRPDVLHVHGAFWWTIPPALAARLVGSRVIVKVTRDGQDDPDTVFSKRVMGIPVGRVYGLALSLADKVVVLSQHARESAERAGLGESVTVMRNGVDTPAIESTPERRANSRARYDVPPDRKVAIFVGFLAEHKGLFDLLEAWRRLGDRDSVLWLVGPADGFYRELTRDVGTEVDSLVAEGFKVVVWGHLPPATVAELYWASNVFVLPSYKEGMPNSLMEATVAGCQVVATSIPGITDLLGAHQAHLVEPGDVPALTVALEAALRGPALDLREAARSMSIQAVVESYIEIYKRVGGRE